MVYRPPDVPARPCSLCSKEYVPKHSKAKYCGRDCGRLATAISVWVRAHWSHLRISRDDQRRMVASLLKAVRREIKTVRAVVLMETK